MWSWLRSRATKIREIVELNYGPCSKGQSPSTPDPPVGPTARRQLMIEPSISKPALQVLLPLTLKVLAQIFADVVPFSHGNFIEQTSFARRMLK